MINRVRLQRFKNFEDAEVILGPLTILIGSNASGKSNLRDAFRFLKGISFGYSFAEIIGERYEGGIRQWSGIRGGPREIAYQRAGTIAFVIVLEVQDGFPPVKVTLTYKIAIALSPTSATLPPRVVTETLYKEEDPIFETRREEIKSVSGDIPSILVVSHNEDESFQQSFSIFKPILPQFIKARNPLGDRISHFAQLMLETLQSIQFLDLDPQSMRRPSFPGQITLGDRGENLSSVLQAIWKDKSQKAQFMDWLRELTPMDATYLSFYEEQSGQISLKLVEGEGQETSIQSASDGTLRFLGILAALFSANAGDLYFLDEIDTGIHLYANTKRETGVDMADTQDGGRKVLAAEAARNYDRVRDLCEEIAMLESRIS